MVVQPESRSLTCQPAWEGDYIRALKFHQNWEQGSSALLVLRWEGEGHGMCPGIRVWRLEQLSWEVSHLPVLSTGVGYTYAYLVCWSYWEGLALVR